MMMGFVYTFEQFCKKHLLIIYFVSVIIFMRTISVLATMPSLKGKNQAVFPLVFP